MENQKHIEAYQDLFNCLYSYGLILLQSEMDEIIDLSQKAVEKYNEASGLTNVIVPVSDPRICLAGKEFSNCEIHSDNKFGCADCGNFKKEE